MSREYDTDSMAEKSDVIWLISLFLAHIGSALSGAVISSVSTPPFASLGSAPSTFTVSGRARYSSTGSYRSYVAKP